VQALLSDASATTAAVVVGALGPVGAMERLTDAAYAKAPAAYWSALAGSHLLGWGFLAGAAWLTGRAWREVTAFRLSARGEARWRTLLLGDRAGQRALRERLLDRNPMLWLGSRQQLRRRLLWSTFGLLLAAWLLVRWVGGWQWGSAGTTLVMAGFLQITLKWLVASEAAHRLAADRGTGALELLLTTALGEREVVHGQLQAMVRLFGVPAAALLVTEALLLFTGGSGAPQEGEWGLAMAAMLLFVWDLHALAWTGLWYSVAGRRPHLASLLTVFRVLVVPWMIFLGVLFVVGVWNWTVVAVIWVVIAGVSNHLAWRAAREGLFTWFREAAAGQYRSRPA
jgi:hypothetical protein